jgi:MFS family permease
VTERKAHENLIAVLLKEYSIAAILVGALAMVATYPGRSHGLGMYTEPLLVDLAISDNDGRLKFSMLGFWATLLGSTFCIPIGWLLSRYGQRFVLMLNFVLLGAGVLVLSYAWSLSTLFLGLLLTRGLGQAALSVVSITIVSNAHNRHKLGIAMAAFAGLSLPFHLILIQLVGWGLNDLGASWRTVSAITGLTILCLSVFGLFIPKRSRFASTGSSITLPRDLLFRKRSQRDVRRATSIEKGVPVSQALRSAAFWAFTLTISLWGMIYAGSSLFNQDIFLERGFSRELYFDILSYTAVVGLVSKFAFGWLNHRVRLNHLLALTMILTSISLLGLPLSKDVWHAYLCATFGGIASGGVALLFFSCWGTLFGHRDLGYIQAIAQMFTVLASALGPVLFAWAKRQTDSYSTIFFSLSALAFLLGIWAALIPLPKDTNNDDLAAIS